MIWAIVAVVVLIPALMGEITLHCLRAPRPGWYGREVQRTVKVFVDKNEEAKAHKEIARSIHVATAMLVTLSVTLMALTTYAPDVLDNVFVMLAIAVWVITSTVVGMSMLERYKPPHQKT